MSNVIQLSRSYLPDLSATLGHWLMPGGWDCYTLENPWKENQTYVSSIPEGVYRMGLRESPVVYRTSNKQFSLGWEVRDVPGRTFIMVHPGNYERHTEGCILVGRGFSWNGEEGPMVTHSQNCFRQFMDHMGENSIWELDIRPMTIQYP